MSWYAKAQALARRARAPLVRPDAMGVTLYPDRLILARVGGGRRGKLKHTEIIDLAPLGGEAPAWRPALEALVRKVADGSFSDANVTLVLSSHFVHYMLVPWKELLESEEDQQAFARQRFVAVHGSAAEGWLLRLSAAGPRQPRLACGVPQALIEALHEVMAPLGRRYRSLQPYLMASFNRWRDRLGAQSTWFVAAEPGLACLALLQDGQWHSVRAIRIDATWPAQLPGVLARERLLTDARTDIDRVMVFAPELPAPGASDTGDWKIEFLQPARLPGMAPGTDAPFTIAMAA